MVQEAVSIIEDALYARSPAYLSRLHMLEELIGLSHGEAHIAYMEEYIDLITKHGYKTELSHSIMIALANSQNHDILPTITQNLDSGISQAETDDTPCTEGETDMAKQRKERIRTGYDNNGNPTYKTATGTTPEKLHKSIANIMIESGQVLIPPQVQTLAPTQPDTASESPAFKAYARKWYKKYKKDSFKPSTVAARNSLMENHVYDAFGKKTLKEIGTDDILALYAKKEKAKLARSTIDLIRTFVKGIFDSALLDDLVTKNPVRDKRIKINTDKVSERTALTLEQVQSIINNLDVLDTKEKLLLSLMIYTGARKGEILALKWEDIHDGKIHITRNATYPSNTPEVGTPKTKAGVRAVPILSGLEKILKDERGIGWLFGNRWDTPIHDEKYKAMWESIKKKINIYGATAHTFRHTFITLAALANVNPVTVKTIVGHANIQTTLNIYTHVHAEHMAVAKEQLQGIFAEDSNQSCDKFQPIEAIGL
ncbi:MAG: tyrosine-type recombinase/integrase [Candidatus Limiplasma sp.]|nr:tyrosine-type recombinase/integrase [Candidatus Limiplasma sp.]